MTPPTFDDDVLRLIDLQATIKQLEDELDTIKSRIRAHGPGRVGQLQVRLIPQRRFSPVVAATVLSPEQIAAIAETTTVLSGSRAKQALPPDIYARCLYDIGEPRVTIA